ncbi:putative DNA repair protein Rad26 [Aspergillus brunneoviolaceus CBS 621.78]|uniref:Uncharacterized protein n=1 Tax=Aspergillus brunneoviolaceus CBS 621.78 TaxID=1450534 RepID=A0ACD1G4R9_9EURO|nr:hypothetical protein BO95DRAFT_444378 [Aspergillus brunneoviolaceus CBS 621.78]RAH44279.1 hypothetical protein BO95DRAFT_444378 [Aspergillus brunneoviolaceus CBS 621.78]
MEENDDDFFSDDGFDDLPPGTLYQLEQNAYRATQAPATQQQQQQQPLPELTVSTRPYVRSDHQTISGDNLKPSNATLQPPPRLHSGLTNDYDDWDIGELDAEVLDNGVAIQPDDALQQASVFATPAHHNEPHPHVEHGNIRAEAEDEYGYLPDPMEIEGVGGSSQYAELHRTHAELSEKLAMENERYKQVLEELTAAKSIAETKTGEIAIIRANQAKVTQDYDRQMTALRKAMAEQAARHREEVEAARAEGKMLATENAFLKQDLAEEAMRINQLKAKPRTEEKAPPVTPKKTRVLPFRDGFDDDEILAISPTKSVKSKRTTPTVPGKRKRKLSQDSPTPLQLSPQAEPLPDEAAEDLSDDAMVDVLPEQSVPFVRSYDSSIVKRILNHRTVADGKPDIEVMAGLAFPSDPQQMLSTILLGETAKLDFGNYMVEYGRAIISLWGRALSEKYYLPIPMFMSIMGFLISIDMPSHDPDLIEHLIPILQESGDVNGVPRFKHSPVSRQNLGQVRKTPLSQLEPLVDSTEALSLLFQLACRRMHVEREMTTFWRCMRYDFVLMMLNCSQPLRDISLMLSLLSTSIREGSFGSIQNTEQDQIANENYIVDRVANLLSETPQLDEGQDPYLPYEICDMRREALSFLTSVAFNSQALQSTHGSLILASHPTVLARLIRAMHDEVHALYTLPPEKDLHASMINGLMRLVYGVMQRHREQVDLQAKLCRVAGGKQKFLVVLTRLAFSEGLVLEAGITDDTVEMAHEILDDAVNPQEAEALLEAFPNANRDGE